MIARKLLFVFTVHPEYDASIKNEIRNIKEEYILCGANCKKYEMLEI